MAKLTLSFKGHYLSTHHLDEKPTTIGRDEDCRICVDSLAIAPRHAELVPSEEGYLLLGLNPDYPVRLNNEQVDQASLRHGDLIQIGKHTLVFSEDSLELAHARPTTKAEVGTEAKARADDPAEEVEGGPTDSVTGYMQIQSGPRIGRFLIFRRAVTKLKRAGADGVAVARTGDSYQLVRLKEQVRIRIDGIPIDDQDVEVTLHHSNLVEIDNARFQFFIKTAEGTQGTASKD